MKSGRIVDSEPRAHRQMESVHLKLKQCSDGFFQVRGFLFLFFAFPFQLGQQVLQLSWHTFGD